MKDTLKENLEFFFKHHPTVNAIQATSDGSLFFNKGDAKEHAKANKLEGPVEITREMFDEMQKLDAERSQPVEPEMKEPVKEDAPASETGDPVDEHKVEEKKEDVKEEPVVEEKVTVEVPVKKGKPKDKLMDEHKN